MKMLSFQPASLYENGGCGRVLRCLYKDHQKKITSLVVLEQNVTKNKNHNYLFGY